LPPPPRNAQNRSWWSASLTRISLASAVTTYSAILKKAQRNWWLIVQPGQEVDLCSVDPGFDVDLYLVILGLEANLQLLTRRAFLDFNCISSMRHGSRLRRISHISRLGSKFSSDASVSIHLCPQTPTASMTGFKSRPASVTSPQLIKSGRSGNELMKKY
jgi:hypothetical protein